MLCKSLLIKGFRGTKQRNYFLWYLKHIVKRQGYGCFGNKNVPLSRHALFYKEESVLVIWLSFAFNISFAKASTAVALIAAAEVIFSY